MKRKRAPGGGRKAKAGPTSSLTIRIPDDMRERLESEAEKRNDSVAAVLLWHLRQSFNHETDKQRDPAMRALCFVIAQLANDVVGMHSHGKPEFSWRFDPFFFRAFKIAVAKILDALEPKGEIREPKIPGWADLVRLSERETPGSLQWRFYQSYKTPEDRGQLAAEFIWNDMQRYPKMSWRDLDEEALDIGDAYRLIDATRTLLQEANPKRKTND
jgi:hypothetical protein